MSFAPSASRTAPGRAGESMPENRTGSPLHRASGSPYSRSRDWERVGLVGAGVAIGALLGAGLALLLAPQSGVATRTAIARRVRHAGARTGDAWGDLGGELRRAARRRRRQARRAMERARWAASDAIDG